MKKINVLLAMLFLSTAQPIIGYSADTDSLKGKKVKIGVLTDMSGPYADLGGPNGVIAIQMAVDDFKKAEKPDFDIEVISADHQNKPDIASSKAREWFDNSNVDVITEVLNSGAALAVSDIAAERKKMVILNGPGSSKITNESCRPYTIHWAYNTAALSYVAATAILAMGDTKWYFITNNYAFGLALESEASAIVKNSGGSIVGIDRHPFETQDFSSYLLKAKDSGAQVIAIANAGAGVINAVKQAREFGIKQRVVGLLTQITDVHALGLKAAQGMLFADGFYWDMNDETRAWSKRFFAKTNKMPTMIQAGDYSSTMQMLKAMKATDSKDAAKVVKEMQSKPVNDFFAKNGILRPDGRFVHDMYLVQVKTPEESKGPWDYYTIKATIPGEKAFGPLSASKCPLLKKQM